LRCASPALLRGDVVDRDRLHQALQREVADLLQPNGGLDRRGNPPADQVCPSCASAHSRAVRD
jgi:hypothetical protein